MSYVLGLNCEICEEQHLPDYQGNTCRRCGGLLDVVYDYDRIRAGISRKEIDARAPTIWRWREFLPVREESIVTLGEGCTPLLDARNLGPVYGLERLYIKNDTMNPTGTFKDRGYSVAVSKAVEIGTKQAFTYTSGNAGASFAAYARRAGLNAFILVKGWASVEKLAMMRSSGLPVALWDFESFEPVREILRRASEELGAYQFTVFNNPYRHEGNKSYAYEIWQELGERAPDWVIHPTATGGGIVGSWKGFEELRELGLANRLPRMVAVQPAECAPIHKAFLEGLDVAPRFGTPKATIAQSMSSDAPVGEGRRVLSALRESEGVAVTVTDEEILQGIMDLGLEGVFSEPAGASAVAAAKKLARQGVIGPSDTVVCVVTGTGLKQPDVVTQHLGRTVPRIGPNWDEFVGFVDSVWSRS